MTRALLLAALALAGCASTRYDACHMVRADGFPEGWRLYSCPHGWFTPGETWAAPRESRNGAGYGYSFSLRRGVTYPDARETLIWDRYWSDVVEHERRHAWGWGHD